MSGLTHGEVSAYLKKEAESRRYSAGMNGSFNDGGAAVLEDQVQCWEAGLRGEYPPIWKRYVEKMTQERDPEYKEYLRLLKKFG